MSPYIFGSFFAFLTGISTGYLCFHADLPVGKRFDCEKSGHFIIVGMEDANKDAGFFVTRTCKDSTFTIEVVRGR